MPAARGTSPGAAPVRTGRDHRHLRSGLWGAFALLLAAFPRAGVAQVALGASGWQSVGSAAAAQVQVGVTADAGANRLMVVVLAGTGTTGVAPTCAGTYGTSAFTQAVASPGTQARKSCILTLTESGIAAAGTGSQTLTAQFSAGGVTYTQAWVAVYTGVNQTTPFGASQKNDSSTNAVAYAASLAAPATGAVVVGAAGYGTETSVSYASSASLAYTQRAFGAPNSSSGVAESVYDRLLGASAETDTVTETFQSNTSSASIAAVALSPAPTVTIGNGSAEPASSTVVSGAVGAIDAFSLQAASGTATVTAVAYSISGSAGLANLFVNSTSACTGTTYGTLASPGATGTIALSTSISATTTSGSTNLYLCGTAASVSASYPVSGTVSGMTASGYGFVDNDTASATLTVVPGMVALSDPGTQPTTPTTVTAGTQGSIVGKIALTATGGSVDLTGMNVQNTGTAVPGADIQGLTLFTWSGTACTTTAVAGTTNYSSSLGRWVFAGAPITTVSTTATTYCLGFNVSSSAKAGNTFKMSVASADLSVASPNTVSGTTTVNTAGTFTIGAGATAQEGNVAGGAPLVILLNPGDGQTVSQSGGFRVQVQVFHPPSAPGGTDGVSKITSLTMSVDGAAAQSILTAAAAYKINGVTYTPNGGQTSFDSLVGPNARIYQLTLSTLSAGTHTLQATAGDGTYTSKSRQVVVNVVATTVSGDGNLLVRDNASQACTDCHAVKTHSSQETMPTTTTVQKYGAWGMNCRDCHTPHRTPNIYIIKPNINPPNLTATYLSQVAIKFSTTVGDSGTSTASKASFVNSDGSGPCQACHTRTANPIGGAARWRNPATGGTGNTDNHYTSAVGTVACTNCHKHTSGFKGAGGCVDCHNRAQGSIPRAQIVGGTAGNAGDDFIRPSRHVSNGTTTAIVTNYDCILCHAEGDISSSGANIKTVAANHGGDGGTTTIDLRNVDSSGGTGIAVAWPGKRNASFTATTAQRDGMDSFCMGCHDSNGASAVAVNKNNPPDGMLYSGTMLPTSAQALKPFNVNDTLQNVKESPTVFSPFTGTIPAWRATNGKITNVKGDGGSLIGFNSGNAVGTNWASHHNLNQFAKRYATNPTSGNSTLPSTIWQAYTTKEGVLLNSGAANAGWAAGLHCSDCHLNETNAHGSRNGWYMLSDKSGNDALPTNSGMSSSTDICAKCHNPFNSTRYSHSADASHIQGAPGYGIAQLGQPNASAQYLACLGCHAGGTPGAIHGMNGTYKPDLSTSWTSKQYRFHGGGGTWRWYSPTGSATGSDASWETSGGSFGCYTLNGTGITADTWGGCTHHAVPGTQTSSFGTGSRKLSY
ncbi:MAG TPA: type IV pilin protein [Anaeromyxobacteraceae bacterium]|jgi:hypothetical protein|nr:type IV pilin protein [Anaeromyxobacteraceae bacterium]